MVEDWSRMEQTSKKQRRGEGVWVELKLMREETACMLDDPVQGVWQKALELVERKVGYEQEAGELEKQTMKWMRYHSKKAREMEKVKLEYQLTETQDGEDDSDSAAERD